MKRGEEIPIQIPEDLKSRVDIVNRVREVVLDEYSRYVTKIQTIHNKLSSVGKWSYREEISFIVVKEKINDKSCRLIIKPLGKVVFESEDLGRSFELPINLLDELPEEDIILKILVQVPELQTFHNLLRRVSEDLTHGRRTQIDEVKILENAVTIRVGDVEVTLSDVLLRYVPYLTISPLGMSVLVKNIVVDEKLHFPKALLRVTPQIIALESLIAYLLNEYSRGRISRDKLIEVITYIKTCPELQMSVLSLSLSELLILLWEYGLRHTNICEVFSIVKEYFQGFTITFTCGEFEKYRDLVLTLLNCVLPQQTHSIYVAILNVLDKVVRSRLKVKFSFQLDVKPTVHINILDNEYTTLLKITISGEKLRITPSVDILQRSDHLEELLSNIINYIYVKLEKEEEKVVEIVPERVILQREKLEKEKEE